MEALKKYWLGIVLFLGLILLTYFAVTAFFGFFSGASDSIKATSITAFVSVLVFTVGRYLEQKREANQRINIEKIEVYRKFFDFYFKVFTNESIQEKDPDPDWLAKALVGFQKELVFWGSDSVIKAYINFKEVLAITTPKLAADDGKEVDHLAIVITSAALLLKAMRKDIGYSLTSFSARDLAVFQISGDDPQTISLLSKLDAS